MTKEQALQVLKQTLDVCIKAGVPQSLEQAATIAQAWVVINKALEEKQMPS